MTATRRFGTQHEILTAVVERLREKIADYSESTCFLTDQPVPAAWPAGTVCCTVCIGDGTYPDHFLAGALPVTVTKATSIIVTPWIRSTLDRVGRHEAALVGPDKGLVSIYEGQILSALLCEQRDGRVVAWEPTGSRGEKLLRNQFCPKSSTAPREDADGQFLGLSISFEAVFDWRL